MADRVQIDIAVDCLMEHGVAVVQHLDDHAFYAADE
jgi:hypothetical protein